MTVSAEALRISGLHAPIVRKIAFMKLHLHRGVTFFFPFSLLIVSCRLILSQWAVVLGAIYNSQLHLLSPFASHFLIKTFRNTSPQAQICSTFDQRDRLGGNYAGMCVALCLGDAHTNQPDARSGRVR